MQRKILASTNHLGFPNGGGSDGKDMGCMF